MSAAFQYHLKHHHQESKADLPLFGEVRRTGTEAYFYQPRMHVRRLAGAKPGEEQCSIANFRAF
jgi:hypothetical protein